MKTIYDIARTELRLLFYSPIAWLIIIIFTFQTAISFISVFENSVIGQAMGRPLRSVTLGTFAEYRGLFFQAKNYLYLYIPLLTMGLISREYSSQSIKLLYSSPIKNYEIILGKYLSMMIFGLILIGILLMYVIFGCYAINNIDLPALFTGLFGLYLLICAYAAIGLFMSSITSYQVIAAMGTLAVLAVLNIVGGLWQEIEFVRDLTFWLSINGRAEELVNGLICSEDVIYFLIVILLFILLSIIKLQDKRQKRSKLLSLQKYISVFICVFLVGYVSSRPKLMSYYDSTRTKVRTLTPNSQDVMSKLDDKVTVTTYVNLIDGNCSYALPEYVNNDLKRFKQYRRFKPDLEFKYMYYYDTINDETLKERYPNLSIKEIMRKIAYIYKVDTSLFMSPAQMKNRIDLSSEGYRFVRTIERENGARSFLRMYNDMYRHPFEPEISAAFKRVAMDLPIVGFVRGHGERSLTREGDRDYSHFAYNKTFRYSLINQGFDVSEVNLNNPVPDEINILVIADLHVALNEKEVSNLDLYVSRGGNLLIAAEPLRDSLTNPLIEKFGVRMNSGYLVKDREDFSPDFMIAKPTAEAREFSYIFNDMVRREYIATMPGASALEVFNTGHFKNTPLFVCDSVEIWHNPEDIEYENYSDKRHLIENSVGRSYVTALALEKEHRNKRQKIIILGDADCLSNKEVNTGRKDLKSANYSLITGFFFWLSDEEVPIDVRRPEAPDNSINVSIKEHRIWKIIFIGVIPLILIIGYLVMWFRRRGR